MPVSPKVWFGVGQLAEGFKNMGFGLLLLFYYRNVLGLSGTLAGLAVFLALLVDAVTDPLAGAWSDGLRHRWGRRHPFMYAAAVPFGLAFWLAFDPPSGLGQAGLFAWLLTFAILTRLAMSLYHVPHLALGAEMSTDYRERTAIVSFRTFFGFLGGGLLLAGAFGVFLRPTEEFSTGQLNPAGYPAVGMLFGAGATVAILASALGTHRLIGSLPQTTSKETFGLGPFVQSLRTAWSSRTFRIFLLGVVIFFSAQGIENVLLLHVGTYFWELTTRQIPMLKVLMLVGILLGVPAWTLVGRRVEKKPILLAGVVLFSLFTFLPVVLRLLGFFPGHADDGLLSFLLGSSLLAGVGGAAAAVAAGSLLADIATELECDTGARLQGVLFGGLAFAGKASLGVGKLVAGVGLDVIGFPRDAAPGEVASEVVSRLGLLYGPGVLVLALASLLLLARIPMDQVRYAAVRAKLDQAPAP